MVGFRTFLETQASWNLQKVEFTMILNSPTKDKWKKQKLNFITKKLAIQVVSFLKLGLTLGASRFFHQYKT